MDEARQAPQDDESVVLADDEVRRPARSNLHLGRYRVYYLICFFIGWWFVVTFLLENTLPSIPETLISIFEVISSTEFYAELWVTVRRVFLAFSVGYAVAITIGAMMGRSKKAEAFFEMFIVVGTSQPGLFVSMIILVALGLNERAAFAAMTYLVMPVIAVNFWQGTKDMDMSLDDMAKVFGYGLKDRIRHVILPQLLAPAFASLRHGLGLCWKYVIVLEYLALTSGIGYTVSRHFQLFNLDGVLSWTISFMLFVIALEYLVLRRIERRLFMWRDHPTHRAQLETPSAPASLISDPQVEAIGTIEL